MPASDDLRSERKVGRKAAHKAVRNIEAARTVVSVKVVFVLRAVAGGVTIDARFRRLVIQTVRVSVAQDGAVVPSRVFQLCLQSVVVGIEVVEVVKNQADVWVGNARGNRCGICRIPLGWSILPNSSDRKSDV